MRSLLRFLAIGLITAGLLPAQQTGTIAHWRFDRIKDGRVLDEMSGLWDRIDGHFKTVDGVAGKALKFDGFTTSIDRDADDAPVIQGSFSVHAWVAPQAYPWNWCAVAVSYTHLRAHET